MPMHDAPFDDMDRPATPQDIVIMLDAQIDNNHMVITAAGFRRLGILRTRDPEALSEDEQVELMLLGRCEERGLIAQGGSDPCITPTA